MCISDIRRFVFVLDRVLGDDDADSVSREPSPCDESCDNTSSIHCESSPHPLALSPLTASRRVDTKVTVATQTGHEAPDFSFNPDKMTVDKHCYECKVRYRDPKPQDLVMYLHAWKYRVSQYISRRCSCGLIPHLYPIRSGADAYLGSAVFGYGGPPDREGWFWIF